MKTELPKSYSLPTHNKQNRPINEKRQQKRVNFNLVELAQNKLYTNKYTHTEDSFSVSGNTNEGAIQAQIAIFNRKLADIKKNHLDESTITLNH